MAWYIGQSLPMMAVAFLVGLLVGYLLWGRRYRRLEQAEAVRAVDPATVLPHRGGPSAGTARPAPAAAPAAVATAPEASVTAAPDAAEPDAAEPDAEPSDDEQPVAAAGDPADDEELASDPDQATAGADPVAEASDEDAADAEDQDDDAEVEVDEDDATDSVEATDSVDTADAEDDTDADDDAAEWDGADDGADEAGADESAEQEAHDAAVARWTADDGAAVTPVAATPLDDEHEEPPTAAEIAALADTSTLTASPAEAHAEAEPESLFAAAGQPEPAAPAVTTSDRLERVEGIGPKIALALRTAGIRTFEDLAGADESTLRDALADANLRFAPSLTTWAQQARLLADGDHEGHAALTQQLVAGRAPKAQ